MQGIVHCAVATRVGIQMAVFGGRILGKNIFPYYVRARTYICLANVLRKVHGVCKSIKFAL